MYLITINFIIISIINLIYQNHKILKCYIFLIPLTVHNTLKCVLFHLFQISQSPKWIGAYYANVSSKTDFPLIDIVLTF